MTPSQASVRDHYQSGIDEQTLLARIEAEPDLGDAEQIAALDQFHAGGIAATDELARRAGIAAGMRVFDAGSGLGGPARRLAAIHGATVVGIDLTPAYVAAARLLARRTGLADRVTFEIGSITATPFADATFDLVWTQHVVMNIADRAGLYREFRRVLKPGGRLAFYDPFLPVTGEPPVYPTPWAASAAASTLLTEASTREALVQAGFVLESWSDVTDLAASWSAAQRRLLQPTANTLDLGVAMGARLREMVMNFQRNLGEGRLRLGMGVCIAA